MGTVPFVSVVIPVRNEARFIGRTLDQLLAQDYPAGRFEILVADGGSSDGTPEVVKEYEAAGAHVRLLENPGRWSSAGRNAAVRASRGELVVVIDGHCELDSGAYLAELVKAFAASGADCVGRPQPLEVPGASRVQRAIAAARASRLGHHPDSHIYSGRAGFVPPQSVAVAYRREVFDRVGYFDESFDACEDVEFNQRVALAGLRCYFTPRVRVRYYPRDRLSGLFRQMVRYGRGRVRLFRKHPETFTLPGFLPAALLAGVIAGPLLACVSSLLAYAYFGGLALYGLVVLLFSVSLAQRQREPGLLPLLPLVFAAIHLGAGTGQWWEWLAPQKRLDNQPEGPAQGHKPEVPAKAGAPSLALQVCLPSAPSLALPVGVPRAALLNALTIDVEDYYHVSGFEHVVDRARWESFEPRVEANTRKLLDILAEARVRATFFVLGWVGERRPGLVRAIRDAGHEVGCHSYAHRLVYEQTPADFRADLRRARRVLEDALGGPVTAYRAPSFSITARSLWALDVLAEEGFGIDSSIYPTHHDRYGIVGTPLQPHALERPAGTVWEFPPPVWKVAGYPLPVGGGGYFRLYPYALTRRALRAINGSGRPFAAYLHPWEVDPDQPRLRPGRVAAFRHYVNLRRTQPRLRHLLRDFAFDTLSAALESWRGQPAAPLRRAA
jgi:polysaccharide deacetylase family protein (PEP-CTERM system associated)